MLETILFVYLQRILKQKTMKKTSLLFIGLFMAIGFLQAQHCDSIHNHMAGHYGLFPTDAIQLADGNILIHTWQDSLTTYDNTQEPIPYLIKYYKISRHGADILDSITFDAHDNNLYYQMERLHNSDNKYGNVMIGINPIGYSEENNITLTFFDDDLNFNDEMEVTFPVAEPSAIVYYFFIDSNDDLIVNYFIDGKTCFSRFRLDGTLKHTKAYHEDVVPNAYTECTPGCSFRVDGLKQYSSNPLGYNYFGVVRCANWGEGECWGFELDSLFEITNKWELNDSNPGYPYYTTNPYSDVMLSQGDGTAYFVRNVWWQYSMWGTVIQKVNEYNEVIGEVVFQPCPRPYNQIKCIDMEKDNEGNLCYSFFGLDMDSCHYVATTKVDPDLNILWERYALRMQAPYQEFMHEPKGMKVFDDGAVLVFGYNYALNWDYYHYNPNNEPFLHGLFLTLMYDEIEGVAKLENVFRPYLFYPNPAQDQLHLQYSPDETPVQIELYDLQGRLVRTQSNVLERLDMQGLTAGQYLMKVTMEDGKLYTDKIMKQ